MNHMTTGQNYSDHIAGDYDWTADGIPRWHELTWERGELLEEDIDEREEGYLMTAEHNGITYEGTGIYSCGELITVEDIEIKR